MFKELRFGPVTGQKDGRYTRKDVALLIRLLRTCGLSVDGVACKKVKNFGYHHPCRITIEGVDFEIRYMTNGMRLIPYNMGREVRIIHGRKDVKWVHRTVAKIKVAIS